MTRNVTFESVFKAVFRRHGKDPFGDAITHDARENVVEKITDRAQTAWAMWPWAELTRTEERAYRQVWNATVQYRRVAEEGFPDEFYFLVDKKYYKVRTDAPTDPPVGTAPSNATYFAILDPVTTFVARDQPYKRPLGQTFGVWASDPSLNGCCLESRLSFTPSERGTKIVCGPLSTVFIQHLVEEPEYTMEPYIEGKAYLKGDRVFFSDGNCYKALADNINHPPSEVAFWMLIPVPAMFATYLKEGAYADTLIDTFPGGEDQVRLARAAAADKKATDFIYGLIDDLLEQGQKFYYLKSRWACRSWHYDGTLWWSQGGMYNTERWTGDVVYPLTDAIEVSNVPPPPAPTQAAIIYRPEIVSLTGTEPSLKSLPSAGLGIGTLIKIVIDVGGSKQEQSWYVQTGPALGPEPTMGEVSPADYNVSTNNKKYVKVI